MSVRKVLLAASTGVALLLAGCTDDERPVPEAVLEASDTGAGVAEPDPDVLVEQTVSDPDAPNDRVTIGVASLTVEGPTMVLRLVITPDFASVGDGDEIDLGDAWGEGEAIRFGSTLRLIDRANLKEYSVIRDSVGVRWANTANGVSTTNGVPMYAFAVFAAPEDDIDTVDVLLREIWPEFTDVPITR